MHTLRPLTQADLTAILNFERTNRAFFEQWVPPRPSWFFNDQSRYTSHMNTLLKESQNGTFKMYVLIGENAQIIGRVNLTISSQPSLGYRISYPHTGSGLATAIVNKLCIMANKTHCLSEITAQAAHNNPASQQVLIKMASLAPSKRRKKRN